MEIIWLGMVLRPPFLPSSFSFSYLKQQRRQEYYLHHMLTALPKILVVSILVGCSGGLFRSFDWGLKTLSMMTTCLQLMGICYRNLSKLDLIDAGGIVCDLLFFLVFCACTNMLIGKKYPKNHTLLWVISRVMLGPLTASLLPRLALTLFRFMQPLLIHNITKLVRDPDSESATNRGWGLTAAFGLVYIGLAVTGGAYQHKTNRMVTMVRGSLVNAIYTKTLDLSVTSLDESAAVTLMSLDVERICTAILPIHNLWSSPLEITLAIWLLQKEIGVALLGPLFITCLAISGPFLISRQMGKAQKAWIESVQTRIDTTAKMLQTMKGVKMLGLDSKMVSIIHKLRLDEIAESLKMRKLFVAMLAFGNMSDIFAPGAAFAIYVIVASTNGQILDVSSAFTALSLISLLVAPIRAIVFAIPPLIAAIGCFDRIESFISSPTKRDHRMPLQGQPNIMTRQDAFARGITDNRDIELEDFTPQINENTSSAIISVKNLTLTWSDEDSPVIDDVSFSVQSGDLTMIVGPVGCGKSSLLRGLLGETPSSKGNVYIDREHVAFVDQVPWIRNSSIRSNIIGVSIFNPEWYSTVVYACALDTDIEILSEGDNTKAGSTGAALSGGQRLRIVCYVLFAMFLQLLILYRRLLGQFIPDNEY